MIPLHTCEACGSHDVDVARHDTAQRQWRRTASAYCLDCGRITASYWGDPLQRCPDRAVITAGLRAMGLPTWAELRL